MSDLRNRPASINEGPEPFTKVCRRCGQYVNPRAYVCPYCKKQLRTSPVTALIALFIGTVMVGTIVAGVVKEAVPGSAPASSSAAPEPKLNVCIDANSLLGRRPRDVIPRLRQCGWDRVEYKPSEDMIELHASDGSAGLVQYDKDVLLFANFDVPRLMKVTPDLIATALRTSNLGPPSNVQASGMDWDSVPSKTGTISGVTTNTTTHFSATYVSNERIRRWENEE